METPATPTLPINRIVQGKNPREYFDPVEMADLEAGLRAAGRVFATPQFPTTRQFPEVPPWRRGRE